MQKSTEEKLNEIISNLKEGKEIQIDSETKYLLKSIYSFDEEKSKKLSAILKTDIKNIIMLKNFYRKLC